MKTFFFFGDRLKNFCDLFFFWRALALVSLVLGLGLEHSCTWPRECLSSERLSLASSLVSSTPPRLISKKIFVLELTTKNEIMHCQCRASQTHHKQPGNPVSPAKYSNILSIKLTNIQVLRILIL